MDEANGGRGAIEGRDDGGLATTMARLAAGDPAALVTLQERFRPELARALRAAARTRGASLGPDEVAELVTDLALELYDVAAAWSPDGAPPWVWARRRVEAVVDRHVGQWASSLDEASAPAMVAEPPAAPGREDPVVVVFERLARQEPVLALLDEALHRVASDRDRALFLETAVQRAMGDRAPSATVATLLGLRPDTVRQQGHRVRSRVRQLAATDPRFAVLADLPGVA